MENNRASLPHLQITVALAVWTALTTLAVAAGGSLTVTVSEEDSGESTIARFEMHRIDAPNKTLPIRRTVPAGIGVILDRELLLEMPEANYQFKLTRGPEYRMISGTFALERSSLDSHHVELPRMANLLNEGWISGDCATPASDASLPLRMASEDCHLAASIGHLPAKPIAGRSKEDTIQFHPSWARHDVRVQDGLAFYGLDNPQSPTASDQLPIQRMLAVDSIESAKIAIENPFAWELPVWLASGRIDGIFLMGDWLRLDRQIKAPLDGRPAVGPSTGDARSLGRWAEKIYWNLLEAGFRLPPLSGTGDRCGKTPVGYNRLYVASADQSETSDHPLHVRAPESQEAWWEACWKGKSVVTNGPLLRPKLAGRIPGYVFSGTAGEKLVMQPELNLSVRDPVDYLEVIHNGKVHYSARLDEFAKAGGVIPAIETEESGWVIIRVATLYEDHFRAAISAPWYIEFDSQPRITEESIRFFQTWQTEYETRLKKLGAVAIQKHAPFVIASREFWSERFDQATSVR